MSKQHYIPAAYIGNFSKDEFGPGRTRMVWVKRRNITVPYKQKPEKIAFVNDLYSPFLDNQWNHIEANLPGAILELINSNKKPLLAIHWLHVLVPFFTQFFIRGYEFNKRFNSRFSEEFNELLLNQDMNAIRMFEMQRLYAPVMYADWIIIHNISNVPIILNDIGYTLMRDYDKPSEVSYAFPLNKNTVLKLSMGSRTLKRIVPIEKINNVWQLMHIEHKEITRMAVINLNKAMSNSCLGEIYGPTNESVDIKFSEVLPNGLAPGPYYLTPNNKYLMECEKDYLKFLSMIL